MEHTKEGLRAQVRAARRARTEDPATAAAMAERVTDIEVIRDACAAHAVVACYVSRPEEPDTSLLRQALHAAGARVVVPRVVGDALVWCEDDPLVAWAANEYGIHEPTAPPVEVEPAAYIVPALAIDARGNRLGQGGGYYDRTLADVDGPIVVALVFEDEMVDELPTDPHDRGVDVAVTDQRVRWFTMPD